MTLDEPYKAGTIVVARQTSSSFVAIHWTKFDRYTDDSVAEGAVARLDAWASDGSISPLEKTSLRQQMYDIKTEYQEIISLASSYGLSYVAYTESYNKAVSALAKYTADEPENIEVGADYADIQGYYDARQSLRSLIDSRIKAESDKAYTKALEADGKAETLSEDLRGVKVDMESVKEQTDREYTIWYADTEPTLENEPAVNWNTDELKALHEQDLYFSDTLGRAWRFISGAWVEITDARTIAALEKAQQAMDKASDFDYLKATFSPNENVLQGGVIMSKLVSVVNEENQVEAFINGSDFAADEEDGKLIFAGGVPETASDGSNDLEKRAAEAGVKFYESGAGQYANGNVRWTKEGITYRKAPDLIVWSRVLDLYSDGDIIDLTNGCYIDLCAGNAPMELWLPDEFGYDFSISLRSLIASRNDFAADLRGRFRVSGEGTTVFNAFKVYSSKTETFELEYNSAVGMWWYNGNYKIVDGVVYALPASESSSSSTPTTPATEGYTGSFTINGNTGSYTLTFENGLLKTYNYSYTGGGN